MGKSIPQRRQDQQRRCDELLAAYRAKERKRRKYEGRSSDGRHQAIAQLSALLEVIRRKQYGKH